MLSGGLEVRQATLHNAPHVHRRNWFEKYSRLYILFVDISALKIECAISGQAQQVLLSQKR